MGCVGYMSDRAWHQATLFFCVTLGRNTRFSQASCLRVLLIHSLCVYSNSISCFEHCILHCYVPLKMADANCSTWVHFCLFSLHVHLAQCDLNSDSAGGHRQCM